MMKYFIDTNYLLRLLLRDNEEQFQVVYSLFSKAVKKDVLLFSSHIVFFELYWVLSSFYKEDKVSCVRYLEKILEIEYLYFPQRSLLLGSVHLFARTKLDLEDCYNILFARLEESDIFGSFDKDAVKVYDQLKY